MLIEEETSANLELVPGMSGENILPEFNAEGIDVNLEHVDSILENADANLEVAIGSTIRYKILSGVLGTIGIILALAVLLKIIGGCYRVSSGDSRRKSFNEKLKSFFIENDQLVIDKNHVESQYAGVRVISSNDNGYADRGAVYKLAMTTLHDIRDESVIPVIKLKNRIVGLFKKKEARTENEYEYFYEDVQSRKCDIIKTTNYRNAL